MSRLRVQSLFSSDESQERICFLSDLIKIYFIPPPPTIDSFLYLLNQIEILAAYLDPKKAVPLTTFDLATYLHPLI